MSATATPLATGPVGRWDRSRCTQPIRGPPPGRVLVSAHVELTDSRNEQLRTFLEEQGSDQFELRPAANLPESYVEAVLLDADGEPTSRKRILFP